MTTSLVRFHKAFQIRIGHLQTQATVNTTSLCDRIWENQRVSRKNQRVITKNLIPFFYLLCRVKMPSSQIWNRSDTSSSSKMHFFFFISISVSCSKDYFRTYVIINFIADRLVFPNTVTHAKLFIMQFHSPLGKSDEIMIWISPCTVEPQSYGLHSYGILGQPDTDIEYIFGKYHQGTGHQF